MTLIFANSIKNLTHDISSVSLGHNLSYLWTKTECILFAWMSQTVRTTWRVIDLVGKYTSA